VARDGRGTALARRSHPEARVPPGGKKDEDWLHEGPRPSATAAAALPRWLATQREEMLLPRLPTSYLQQPLLHKCVCSLNVPQFRTMS
jgi:hypothetical protein